MTSSVDALDAQELRTTLLVAMQDLPADELQGLMARFVEAAVEYETTTKIGAFQSLARELRQTAILRRTPGYATAVAAADDIDPATLTRLPVQDFLRNLDQSA